MHTLVCIFIGFMPHLYSAVFTIQGRSILNDGTPFTAKGLDYNLAPPGTGTWDRLTEEEGMQNIFIRDLDNMQAMGANVVRMYVWNTAIGTGFLNAKFTHTAFLDACWARKIYVIIPVTIWPESSVTDTAKYNEIIDDLIPRYYSHPAVFMWTVGNELNNQGRLGGTSFSRLFELINGYAGRIRDLEISLGGKKHLISTPFMDMDIVENLGTNGGESKLSNLDIHCFQLYCRSGTNGKSFGNFFNEFAGLSQKPLLITEFGIDAFKTTTYPAGVEDGVAQAEYLEALWGDIAANSDVCSGGLVFSYMDEWWKGGSNDGQNPVQTYPPGGHSIGCFPDPMQNEGWYGVYKRPFGSTSDVPSDVRNVKSDYMNQLEARESVTTLAALWKPDVEIPPSPCQGKTCGPNGKCDPTQNGLCICETGFVGTLCENAVANCRDGVRNGEETDIDCGGSTCPSCDANRWFAFNWEDCSLLCGGGMRTRKVECRDAQNNVVDASNCASLHPVTPTEECNMQACTTFMWTTSDWEDCDAPCDGGQQTRTVKCSCSGRCSGTTPTNSQSCNSQACGTGSAYWRFGPWTTCSRACNGGTQSREVECYVRTSTSSGWTISISNDCANSGQMPATSRACNIQSCDSYAYFACPWEQCTAECGGAGGSMFGEQTRTTQCISFNQVVDQCFCEDANVIKPDSKKLGCNKQLCTNFNWMTSSWGACNPTTNKRRRTVHCHTVDGANAPNTDCQREVPEKYPVLVEDCDPLRCPDINPGTDNLAGCGLDIIIDDFSGSDKRTNLLQGDSDVQPNGYNTFSILNSQLTLNAKTSSSWWYSILSQKCLDLTTYRQPTLYLSILGPANAGLTVEIQQKDYDCISVNQSKTIGIPISTTGLKFNATIPLTWYEEKGLDSQFIHAISFINLTPDQDFIIDQIGFSGIPCTVPTIPSVNSVDRKIWSVSILVALGSLFIFNTI